MSLVYERQINGPATHAFIIGVGSYPYAKPGASLFGPNTPLPLSNVPDLDSAPVGAKLFCDWLLSHADGLPAPLGSVHLALSAPPTAPPSASQYEWKGRLANTSAVDPRGSSTAVSSTDGASIQQDGTDWSGRLLAIPDQVAVFYICGHGAAVPTRSVVLLSDVAGNVAATNTAWQSHVDVQYLASVMSRQADLREGYLFVDACQELITDIVLGQIDPSVGMGDMLRFFPQGAATPRNKVLLLVPGPMGQLTYDDGQGGGGRFTQVLVEALNGAGARNYTGAGQWGVLLDGLPRAMNTLYRLRGWSSDAFNPTPIRSLVSSGPIVKYQTPPEVPFVVMLDPAVAINHADQVCLRDAADNVIVARADQAEQWIGKAQARMDLCFVQATFNKPNVPYVSQSLTRVDLSEMRVDPVLLHRVT
ncbi:hypothetical protein J2R76_004005 [Bradyrhizobium sp. USDA 4532]|uniref:hypothetical protein n=1 Tax=unclassified Bradyrhizobium TaxID=2631580 RepID=UPI0020A12A4E|nr:MULTISPECIES: hypothetical protein [unclassified Bradyrhizobium]MCP1835665.1 hypothetical protein [Bradyrhizobium sp. USDA 4545]MCP1920414.1 hypothetical protein [Bradyrhizobium sp. USDA 4532]